MKNLTWVLFSKRGFQNECCVAAFDTVEEAQDFILEHEHYAEIKSEHKALKENDFGYYIYNGEQIYI